MENGILVIIRHKLGRKRFLMRSLSSFNNQTYKLKSFLLLCMDSTEDEILKEEYINNLKIKNESLASMGTIFNKINESSARMICFLDDDDSWAPEYLSRLSSLLIKTNKKHPSVKSISCHTNKVNEFCEGNRVIIDNTLPWNHYLSTGPIDFDVIFYKNTIPLSSCIFIKDDMIDIIKNHETTEPDFFWPFFIDFLSKNDMWVVNEALAFYHFRDSSDLELGNYSIINNEESEINYKLKINSMLRAKNDNNFITLLLTNLLNKTQFHRLANMERKLNG